MTARLREATGRRGAPGLHRREHRGRLAGGGGRPRGGRLGRGGARNAGPAVHPQRDAGRPRARSSSLPSPEMDEGRRASCSSRTPSPSRWPNYLELLNRDRPGDTGDGRHGERGSGTRARTSSSPARSSCPGGAVGRHHRGRGRAHVRREPGLPPRGQALGRHLRGQEHDPAARAVAPPPACSSTRSRACSDKDREILQRQPFIRDRDRRHEERRSSVPTSWCAASWGWSPSARRSPLVRRHAAGRRFSSSSATPSRPATT